MGMTEKRQKNGRNLHKINTINGTKHAFSDHFDRKNWFMISVVCAVFRLQQ